MVIQSKKKNSSLILATYPFYKGILPNTNTRCKHNITQKNIDKISEYLKSKPELLSEDDGNITQYIQDIGKDSNFVCGNTIKPSFKNVQNIDYEKESNNDESLQSDLDNEYGVLNMKHYKMEFNNLLSILEENRTSKLIFGWQCVSYFENGRP